MKLKGLAAELLAALALAEKVELGRFTQPDALRIARMVFFENPKQWYGLG